jgi:hypothetical protein
MHLYDILYFGEPRFIAAIGLVVTINLDFNDGALCRLFSPSGREANKRDD